MFLPKIRPILFYFSEKHSAFEELLHLIDLLRRGRLCQLMTNFILDKAKFAVAYG